MESPGHQRSMTSYDPKMIFRIFWPIKIIHEYSKTFKKVTCSTRCKEHAVRWNFVLAPWEAKVIGDHGVSWLFGTWPDLRCDWLTYDLKFIYQSLRLANGAQSALWAEINRQLTRIRVRRIFACGAFWAIRPMNHKQYHWLVDIFADVSVNSDFCRCWRTKQTSSSAKLWPLLCVQLSHLPMQILACYLDENRTSCDNYNQNWILYSENV